MNRQILRKKACVISVVVLTVFVGFLSFGSCRQVLPPELPESHTQPAALPPRGAGWFDKFWIPSGQNKTTPADQIQEKPSSAWRPFWRKQSGNDLATGSETHELPPEKHVSSFHWWHKNKDAAEHDPITAKKPEDALDKSETKRPASPSIQQETPEKPAAVPAEQNDASEHHYLPVDFAPFRNDQEAIEECLNSCDKLLASGVVKTIEGGISQKSGKSNAYIECADKCVLRHQRKPTANTGGDGGKHGWIDKIATGWQDFKDITKELMYYTTHSKIFWTLLIASTLVVLATKLRWFDSVKDWVDANAPGSTELWNYLMELRVVQWVMSVCGGTGEEGEETEGLTSTRSSSALMGDSFWAWSNALMYRGGQVSVYVLSASYLPDSVAQFIPWSDVAVRIGSEGAGDDKDEDHHVRGSSGPSRARRTDAIKGGEDETLLMSSEGRAASTRWSKQRSSEMSSFDEISH